MFQLTVEREFCAAHALAIAGVRETVHGHNFRVVACVGGPTLDDDGLLCDFHTVEAVLADVLGPFHNGDLNRIPPFDRRNPSAENIARHIGDELNRRLAPGLGAHGVRVEWVSVTEAPGCVAKYTPGTGVRG